MGTVCHKILKKMDIAQDVFYADLNWDNLMRTIMKNDTLYHDFSKFPSVSRDLALLIDKSVQFEQIEQIARQTAVSYTHLDVYKRQR